MRSWSVKSVISVAAAGVMCSIAPSLAVGDTEACSLLTATTVSAALGATVGNGETLHLATQPDNRGMCQWAESDDSSARSRKVQLDVFGQVGKMSPTDRFTSGLAPFPGIAKMSIGGVGDAAYFTTNALGTSLTVRKGRSAFQIRVYGLSDDETTKSVERSLALAALARL